MNDGERRGVSPPVQHIEAGLDANSLDLTLAQILLYKATHRTGVLTPRRSPWFLAMPIPFPHAIVSSFAAFPFMRLTNGCIH